MSAREAGDDGDAAAVGFDPDVVEYVVIAIPDLSATAVVAEALEQLVTGTRIRILDLAVVRKDKDGVLHNVELEDVAGLAPLEGVEGAVGSLMSEGDIDLACGPLPSETTALVLVVEDRWAEPLAEAARFAGGRIVGGERIPRRRLQALGRAGIQPGPRDVE